MHLFMQSKPPASMKSRVIKSDALIKHITQFASTAIIWLPAGSKGGNGVAPKVFYCVFAKLVLQKKSLECLKLLRHVGEFGPNGGCISEGRPIP